MADNIFFNENIIPLLNGKWTISNYQNETSIVGQWWEDNNLYKIICPIQIAECLVQLQNALYTKYNEIEATKKHLMELEKELNLFKGVKTNE